MLYYDKEKYRMIITEELIQRIENENGVKCLFGAAYSTYVYGFSNRASDFDFFLVVDKQNNKEDIFRIFIEKNEIDIICLDYFYIRETSIHYLNSIISYPSCLSKMDDKRKVNKYNFFREDFTSQIMFEILYSDYIWDSGFLTENLKEILDNISYIGICDYYFTRAYMNLKNILNKESVYVAKYLTTFMGVSCLKSLEDKAIIPYMNLEYMVNKFLPSQFEEFIEILIDKQRNLLNATYNQYKLKVYVKMNAAFNKWIEDELERLAKILFEYKNKNLVRFCLGDETILYRSLK